MTALTFDAVRTAILDAGFEVLRAKGSAIDLAQRVRSHLMDAGVSIHLDTPPTVAIVVRSQLSDFPSTNSEAIFTHLRGAVDAVAHEHGFMETQAATRTIHDPSDDARILDTWFELTYSKPCDDLSSLVNDVRWALNLPKYVKR